MATRPAAPARKRAGGAEDGVADPALPQKKRARHRLIGAIALCLLAAIVVPLLLESEPSRPPNDVSIVIPSRDTPLPARAVATPDAKAGDAKAGDAKGAESKGAESKGAGAGVARGTVDAAPTGEAASKDPKVAAAKDAGKADAKADPKVDPRADPKATAKGDPKAAAKADTKADSKADSKAAAKAEPRPDEIGALADAAAAKARGETLGRYLLQVGAFGGEAGASAAVERVQATGLRAFTEKVKTERGERVRVRVGPFPSREAAEQARGRLKAAGIEAAVIAP
ncbi:MAG: SPOR domain-containing protein [Burkholderiaceae bacterium]|nr:SPOR domain-containing protein [Burkholderiales bacterium]MCZ8337131.1 SPOR domain-containing protein [Burkholderiaceae bacterium]